MRVLLGLQSLPDATALAVLLSRALVLLGLLAQIFVAWKFWHLTWDDSAITLGFSRTFALTGRIEPTPGSLIVEGYSSTLWMLLMAAVAELRVTPQTLLFVAKLSTLALNLCNILLIRRWLLSWNGEILANLVAGTIGVGCMFYETINGMETPLILFLVLAMLLLLPRPGTAARIGYLILGAAFVLVRWEAAWLLVPFLLVERPRRRAWITTTAWGTILLVSNLIRWRYFGSFLPNTIIAKAGPPYSEPMSAHELVARLSEPLHLLKSCRALLVLAILCFVFGRYVVENKSLAPAALRELASRWQFHFTALFTLFSLILIWVIGFNTGPAFRAFYSAWPFFFTLLLYPIVTGYRSTWLSLAVLAVCALALKRMHGQLMELQRPDAPVYDSGTTVDSIHEVADALEQIRRATHASSLVYASPDMGGIQLYGHNVVVVDLGLLCDPVLARKRYAAIGSYVLDQRRPDVMVIGDGWARDINILQYPQFRARYQPVLVGRELFYVNRQRVQQIDPARLHLDIFTPTGEFPVLPGIQPDQGFSDDPLDDEADSALNRAFGTFLVLQ